MLQCCRQTALLTVGGLVAQAAPLDLYHSLAGTLDFTARLLALVW